MEGGGEGQVVHLEEHGRGRNGGVTEAGTRGSTASFGRKEFYKIEFAPHSFFAKVVY